MNKYIAFLIFLYLTAIFPQVAESDEFFVNDDQLMMTGDNIVSIPTWLFETCNAKGDVVIFAYENRDKAPLDDVLKVLEGDWTHVWREDGVKRISYIDMQRIIRDAYRKDDSGKYIVTVNSDADILAQVDKEVHACLHGLQF